MPELCCPWVGGTWRAGRDDECVNEAELQEEDGGLLEESAKVDDLDELMPVAFVSASKFFA